MLTMRQLFNHLHAQGDNNVRASWKYNSYETKLGNREEIAFIGGAIIFQSVPPSGQLSLLIIQTSEIRVYKHANYLMKILCPLLIEGLEEHQEVEILMYGQGYQAFMGVDNVKVTTLMTEGTVLRRDNYGGIHEKFISKVRGVSISRKVKP